MQCYSGMRQHHIVSTRKHTPSTHVDFLGRSPPVRIFKSEQVDLCKTVSKSFTTTPSDARSAKSKRILGRIWGMLKPVGDCIESLLRCSMIDTVTYWSLIACRSTKQKSKIQDFSKTLLGILWLSQAKLIRAKTNKTCLPTEKDCEFDGCLYF